MKKSKEEKDYDQMLVDVSTATNKQVDLIAGKLDLNKQDAFTLMQTITIEKLTYLMAQILEGISSTNSRSAVTEEHTNKDTPHIVT
tara:strand:- start:1031 stop:1288 length:258 start_codon:yes stop_codon:yes gene_type:complete